MSKYNLLLELIELLQDFEKNNTDSNDLENFVFYLKDKVLLEKNKKQDLNPDFAKKENQDYKKFEEVEFSTLLTNLYRFAKHYLKKTFKDTLFKTIDEFSFLATLVKENNLLKSELINRHLLEISTGTEVLRRLIKDGLIYEYKDASDGRAKRVALTQKGYDEITRAFYEMFKVAKIIKGNLYEKELNEAIIILKKLNHFHWNIHKNDKDLEIDKLYSKYIK